MSPEATSQDTPALSPAAPRSAMHNEPSTSSDEINQSGILDSTSQGVNDNTTREVLASRPFVPPRSSTATGQPGSRRAPAPINTSNSPTTESGLTGSAQDRQREQRSEDAHQWRWFNMMERAIHNLSPYDREAIRRQVEKNVMRLKVFIKLGVDIGDLSFDRDTILYSALGVTEAEIQAMIKEMMEDGEE